MSELYNVIAGIVERDRQKSEINPSWIANEAMRSVDPERCSVPCVYMAAFEHCKQYARGLLRRKFDPTSADAATRALPQLFTDLQWRYASAKRGGDGDPVYVLRDYATMSRDDSFYNVDRFRAASEALAAHADALESWEAERPPRAA